MPCPIYFDNEVLRIDFDDVITSQEFFALAKKLEELELPAPPHRISDLTRTSGINLDFQTLFAFTERRKTLTFSRVFKSAIVAPKVVHFGVARMFQALNQHPQIKIEIFRDLPAAQAWIAKS